MSMHYWINLYENAVREGVDGIMAFAKAVETAASGFPATDRAVAESATGVMVAAVASVVNAEVETAAAVASGTDVLTTTLEGVAAADEVSERDATLFFLALAVGFVLYLSLYQYLLMQKFVIGRAGSSAAEYPNCTTEPATGAANSDTTNDTSETIGPERSPTTMDTPVLASPSIQLTPPLTYVSNPVLSTEPFLCIGPGPTRYRTENHNPGPTPSPAPTPMPATESTVGCTMPSPPAPFLEPKLLSFESTCEQSPLGEGTSITRAAATRTDMEETSMRDVNWTFSESNKRKLVALEDKEEISTKSRTETQMKVESESTNDGNNHRAEMGNSKTMAFTSAEEAPVSKFQAETEKVGKNKVEGETMADDFSSAAFPGTSMGSNKMTSPGESEAGRQTDQPYLLYTAAPPLQPTTISSTAPMSSPNRSSPAANMDVSLATARAFAAAIGPAATQPGSRAVAPSIATAGPCRQASMYLVNGGQYERTPTVQDSNHDDGAKRDKNHANNWRDLLAKSDEKQKQSAAQALKSMRPTRPCEISFADATPLVVDRTKVDEGLHNESEQEAQLINKTVPEKVKGEPRASQLVTDTTPTKPKEKFCDGSENQSPLFRTVYDVDEQTTLRVLVSSDEHEQKKRLKCTKNAFAPAQDVATQSADWEKSEGKKRKAAEVKGNEREGIAIEVEKTLASEDGRTKMRKIEARNMYLSWGVKSKEAEPAWGPDVEGQHSKDICVKEEGGMPDKEACKAYIQICADRGCRYCKKRLERSDPWDVFCRRLTDENEVEQYCRATSRLYYKMLLNEEGSAAAV